MKDHLAFLLCFSLLSTALVAKASIEKGESSFLDGSTLFQQEIKPIFEKKCMACHSAQDPQSGLVLETIDSIFEGGSVSGPAVIPGDSSQSPLMLHLRGDKEPRMPLDDRLPEAEIALIARWIDQLKSAGQEAETEMAGLVSDHGFEETVRPILEKSCFSCHSSETHRSGLVLETVESLLKGGGASGPAIVPGKSGESPLISHLRGEKTPRMPLEGTPLPKEEITQIASWIDDLETPVVAEAKPQLGWPWTKLQRPEVPKVQHKEWVTNPIDAFILAKMETKGLEPSPMASKRALLRRIAFDLTGLPPTPEEMQQFLKDPSPDAYGKEINRLLTSPHYGERWGRHWLDLARYGDSLGGNLDIDQPNIWRYRDYVIRSFNQDRPYDEFIKQQLAGDTFMIPYRGSLYDAEGKIALGFLRLGMMQQVARRRELLTDLVGTTGSVFLGLTLACARCHDHKYDPIPTHDYYRMEAFFSPITVDVSPQEIPFTQYEAPNQWPEEWEKRASEWEALLSQRLKSYQRVTQEFKHRVRQTRPFDAPQDLKDGVLPVNNFEFQAALRKGLVFSKAERDFYSLLSRKVGRKGRGPMHTDRYKPLAYSAFDSFRRDAPAIPTTFVLKGGNQESKGEVVKPGFLSSATGNSDPVSLAGMDTRSSGGSPRRLLAEWISSPENPLTARVMVNRIWQHHFSKGLVLTPSDFGQNGSGTLYPDLIDWLASEFIEQGWSIKAMHRIMLNSSLYRQSMHNPRVEEFDKIDSVNRYFWKMEPIRLEAEVIRDSILAVSGQLHLEMGGPPFFPELDDEWMKAVRTYWDPSPQKQRNRKSVYMIQKRSAPIPMMTVFDGPNMNESCELRGVTTVTPQVFMLFNSQFVHRQSRELADRIRGEVGSNAERQIERAFQLALQRAPTTLEQSKSLVFFGQSRPYSRPEIPVAAKPIAFADSALGTPNDVERELKAKGSLADLCLILLNMNEFIFLE